MYAYAAVCPALGKMTSLLLPYANTEMMSLFLEEVAQDFKDYFVVMLVDQAGWHMSNSLRVPENIRLIPQPSHSPELNPAEHIWDELREKNFPNKAFCSLKEVEQVFVHRYHGPGKQPGETTISHLFSIPQCSLLESATV